MRKETETLTFFDFPIEHFADRSTRWLLEDRENVRGLLEIVAEHLTTHLDFSKLVHINRSFIPDNLREQESDIVYKVPFRSESKTDELLIYILIEHQSTVDTTMGFRVLFYMTQFGISNAASGNQITFQEISGVSVQSSQLCSILESKNGRHRYHSGH